MMRAPWATHFGFTKLPFSKTISAKDLDHATHHVVTIVHALGAAPRGFKAELVAQTQSLLAAEEHERRRRVVLVIDEAHLLTPDQLEAIRLLTDADMDSATSCSLLLVGQPSAPTPHGHFAALDQRIATRYQIAPMDLGESAEYLRHQLALVGRTDPLFADDAIARLHKASLGLPRLLNNAATAALIAATTAGKALVDDDCAKKGGRRTHPRLISGHPHQEAIFTYAVDAAH